MTFRQNARAFPPAFKAAHAGAGFELSTGGGAVAMPAGALGIWYMDQYANGSVPNALAVTPTSTDILRTRRSIPTSGFTATTGQTASDGSTDAVRLVATASASPIIFPNAPAGQYTVVVTCKSNTGSNQNFNSTLQSGSGTTTLTALTSWSRVATTKTLAAGDYIQPIQWISGTLDILVEQIEMFPGAVDPGATPLAGHLYLGGTSRYSAAGAYASGALDAGSTATNGVFQFPTAQSFSTFTAVALVSKVAAGSAGEQSVFAKKGTTFGDFQFMLEEAYPGPPYILDIFGGNGRPSGGGNAMGFWNLLNQGYHAHAQRYDGTQFDHFLDDVRVGRRVYAASVPQIVADFVFNQAGGNYAGYKYSAFALYPSALTDAQIRAAVAALQSRAGLSGITATNQSRYYFAFGDSITQGFGASTADKAWAPTIAANASPAVLGNNYGVSGYTLANLTTQLSTVGFIAGLPSLGARKVIVSIYIGTNDLATYAGASDSAAATNFLNDLATVCDALRTAGCKVAVGTLMSRTDYTGATLAAYDARRALVNSAITGGWTHCDGVFDFAGNANLGAVGASNNTTYFGDTVHPNDTGYALMASIAQPVLNAL